MDQRWLNGSNQPLDRFQYGYDADGNALYRDNRVNPIFGELYHVDGAGNGYDGLNQLQQFARGTLSADKGSIAGTHYGTRVYAADAAGNFSSEMVSGVMTNRTHNAQNELTAAGGAGLSFDNAGNETSDGAGDSFSYDAWNRLVSSSKTGLTETYAYDAVGRRTVETVGGTTRQLYYNDRWQVLQEEATAGGAAVTQYVWSALGSDRLVLRDRAPSGSGPLSEHFYVQQDVHGDVTALVNTAGGVSERYVYDPYGGVGYTNGAWSILSASAVGWQVLFQGKRIDRFSLYDDQARVYAAGFERFMQNDPIGFTAHDPNTYRFVGDNPVNYTDPSGLQVAGPQPNPPFVPPPALLDKARGKCWLFERPYGPIPHCGIACVDLKGKLTTYSFDKSWNKNRQADVDGAFGPAHSKFLNATPDEVEEALNNRKAADESKPFSIGIDEQTAICAGLGFGCNNCQTNGFGLAADAEALHKRRARPAEELIDECPANPKNSGKK